ncbi:unnamed protein product [Sphagnum tenellum]
MKMNSDTQLVLDIWEAMRDYLPAAKRTEAAHGLLRAISEYGIESREISSIVDEDNDLEEAYYDIFHEGEYPDDEDDDL